MMRGRSPLSPKAPYYAPPPGAASPPAWRMQSVLMLVLGLAGVGLLGAACGIWYSEAQASSAARRAATAPAMHGSAPAGAGMSAASAEGLIATINATLAASPADALHAGLDRRICGGAPFALASQNWTDGGRVAGAGGLMCRRQDWARLLADDFSRLGGGELEARMDGCGMSAAIPKVAMMFLTRGKLLHTTMWALWFKQAAGLLPADCVIAAACSERGGADAFLAHMLKTCSPGSVFHGGGILSQQHLFSVYVHLPPGAILEGEPSVFHGREIVNRVETLWGDFSLAEAARALLRTALDNPLNQRFILMSEACLPLYPPTVVYQQLMYQPLSKINACTGDPSWPLDYYRWTWRMREASNWTLEEWHWRKSHQWLGLTRKHARAVVDDIAIAATFKQHCTNGPDPDWGNGWRSCFSDEHYFATLLAVHGWDNETDCAGDMTYTEWCRSCLEDEKRNHPKSFAIEEVTPATLRTLRGVATHGCDEAGALAWTGAGFATASQLMTGKGQCGARVAPVLLAPKCPLFARKFSAATTAAALLAVSDLVLADEASRMADTAATDASASACGVGLAPGANGAHTLSVRKRMAWATRPASPARP